MKTIVQRSRYLVLIGCWVMPACGQIETGYFQSKVDHVTQDVVVSRYGAPHKVDKLPEGRTVWTYFDRGSSTTGYGGYASSAGCKAYVLTFDHAEVLRDWKQQDCTSQPGTITEPLSNHK